MEPLDTDLSENPEPSGLIFTPPRWYELYWLRAQLGLKEPMTVTRYIIIAFVVLAAIVVSAYFGENCGATAGGHL